MGGAVSQDPRTGYRPKEEVVMTETPDHAGTPVDEEGRNPTQQRIDEEWPEDVPVDADWVEDEPDEAA
jgi:hypothetical protein